MEKDPNDINDELTIEGMLQVFDKGTGHQADVRAMLGIDNKDINDEKLRDEISKYSMKDSKLKKDGEDEGNIDMGFYFNGLDILEFDTGVLPEEPQDGMTRASS